MDGAVPMHFQKGTDPLVTLLQLLPMGLSSKANRGRWNAQETEKASAEWRAVAPEEARRE